MEQLLLNDVDGLIKRIPKLSEVRMSIIEAYIMLENCFEKGGKLLVAGNGGSAADSEHIVGELMKKFKIDRPINETDKRELICVAGRKGEVLSDKLNSSLPAISLTSNSPLISACANDIDASVIYAQQVYGYGKENDVLLAISTSGNSDNIVNAAIVAKAMRVKVIELTGCNGGDLDKYADLSIRVPENETFLIQELHESIYHCLCLMLEKHFFL